MKYHVEKNIMIDASLALVQSKLEDFKQWNSWSPWVVVEPNCPIKISKEAGEVGHSMEWDGEIIGSGKNTLRETNTKGLYYDLAFFKPWKSTAKTSFLLDDHNGKTKITWTMDSQMPFFLFFMIKTMKNWIGMDYERGLKMLKEICEKGKLSCSTSNKGVVSYQGFSYVGIKRTVAVVDMPLAMQKDFEKLIDDIVVKGQKSAKHWVSIYPKFDIKNMEATYIAAVSDEELGDVELGANYVKGEIKGGDMLEIKHAGSYEFLGNAWSMGMMYLRSKKMKGSDYPFEQYWNSPKETKPEDLDTSIYFPVKK